MGSRVPHEIPGTAESFVASWMELIEFEEDHDVSDFIIECLHHGIAMKSRASYSFRKRVEILSDTMGIDRGPHIRSNLSDVVIKASPGFVWRKRKVTESTIYSWYDFGPE